MHPAILVALVGGLAYAAKRLWTTNDQGMDRPATSVRRYDVDRPPHADGVTPRDESKDTAHPF